MIRLQSLGWFSHLTLWRITYQNSQFYFKNLPAILLKDFWSLSDHFCRSYIKRFNPLILFRKFSYSSNAKKIGTSVFIKVGIYTFLTLSLKSLEKGSRGGPRTAATSKVELFVIIVNVSKPLTIITMSSTLDVATVLDPPLGSTILKHWRITSLTNFVKLSVLQAIDILETSSWILPKILILAIWWKKIC